MSLIRLMLLLILFATFSACSVQKAIQKQANHAIFQQTDLSTAHIGISIFDADKKQYLYNYQADKYFLPASNTKLFTCYVAMKYLGDSVKGLQYYIDPSAKTVWVRPTGDPTLLHPDFASQPVIDFLKEDTSRVYATVDLPFQTTALGSGWSWGDYQQNYMSERSAFPVYGNLIWINYKNGTLQWKPSFIKAADGTKGDYSEGLNKQSALYSFRRAQYENTLLYSNSATAFRQQQIPFISSSKLVADVLKTEIAGLKWTNSYANKMKALPTVSGAKIIYSRHIDSLLKPMMHQSDNFFAEQSLLMVSDELLGVMNERKAIDTLLKMNFTDLVQKPNWVDGSGLSRYNLFTPMNFVQLLQKMQQDFSWNRITTILPTGGTGTLGNFYKPIQQKIFAKTGTLSGQVALSGFLITKKNRRLIFSVLVNNHQTSAVAVRRAVEGFLLNLYNKY